MASRSSSSSQANQTSLTQDQRVAASDNAIALSAGATLVQEQVSDDIAIASIRENTAAAGQVAEVAGELGRDAGTTARDINRDSLIFAENIVDTAADVVNRSIVAGEDSARRGAELAQGLSETAIANLVTNRRDPTDDTLQNVTKTVSIAAVVLVIGLGAILLLRRSK